MAVAFIMLSSDKARFGRMLENLENDYLQGQNNYPTSITAAYNLLTNWKQDPRNLIRTSGPVSDGVSFTNVDGDHGEQDIALANSGHTKSGQNKLAHITCHKCGKQGHFADKCEEERQTGSMLLTAGIENGEFNHEEHFQFLQHTKEVSLKLDESGKIPKSWILLDNQYTVDVF